MARRKRSPGRRFVGTLVCAKHDFYWTNPRKPPPPENMCPACVAEAEARPSLREHERPEELEVPHPLQVKETPELNRKWAGRARDPRVDVESGALLERRALAYLDAKRRARQAGSARGRFLCAHREDGKWVNTFAKPRPAREPVWQPPGQHKPSPYEPDGPIEVDA